MPPCNANLRTGTASGVLVFVWERVSACRGRRFVCIHQFKPNKSSLSPAPSVLVVIVVITRMAVTLIINHHYPVHHVITTTLVSMAAVTVATAIVVIHP